MGKLSKRDKYIIAGFSLFGLVIVVWVIFVVFEIGKPKPDYDKFKNAMKYYIENNNNIENIVIQDNDSFKVIVKDNWYNASEKDKLKFCNNLRETTWIYANQYNLINNEENVYLHFYDANGIKLVEQEMFEFKILH